ncbi:MAG TPA: SLBB domain-containing protein [Terriglobales bacterium]|nr:SLBB domain-containing protein [Terriglobales bacterium]
MKSRRTACAVLEILLLAASVGAVAQQSDSVRNASEEETYASRTRAVDEVDSRAEREAERLVSLPPEKIVLLLQQEPGLFLEIKKLLVRRAYSQGRVLNPRDLTDEAVFRLLRDDEEVRALVTQQIVDRGYVRAKPTSDELAKEVEQEQRLANTSAGQAYPNGYAQNDGTRPTRGYGSSQQNGVPNGVPYNPNAPQQGSPTPSQPQNQINSDQRRALLQASASAGENTDGLPFEAVTGGNTPPQLSSDQIQQLVNSYGKGQLPAALAGQDVGKLASTLGGNSTQQLTPPQSQEQAYMQQNERLQQYRATSNLPSGPDLPNFRNQQRFPDQPRLMHRASPYADVPSLYDLYSQYSRRTGPLRRFGLDIFENGTGNFDQLPMDLPAGPDYVLGPGDGVNIDLWGSVSQRLHRVIDREGRLSLPEIGSLQAAGHTLGEVQQMVQTSLRSQFRQLEADVSLDRLRTIRIYVVGDVERPGAYDISSLSTPLNALYQAGGPTTRGSMRVVKHYRGNQLVENVDLYDLLLHGVRAGMQRLESGDTILVPPFGQQVTIEGMVRRPGIYELAGEKNLSEVLELAGGVLPSGTLRHVDVERVQAHENRTMLRVDMPETDNNAAVTAAMDNFSVQDGDDIKISPILPFADKTVYLDGHVFRPGKYAYRDGMTVTDLIHSYSDLLPEPYKAHAEIIRLNGPDLKPEIISFNLGDALAGQNKNLALKPFDTVRIFGRFDFEDPPIVTVTGEVRDPGDHVTNGATYLRDAVFLAGNTTPDAEIDDVQVFRKTHDGKLQVIDADLRKAIAGDAHENVLLQPQDRVFVHKNVHRLDPATVEVAGDVARPGKYPLGTEMTATELVKLAGGVRRSAYLELAELTRYSIAQGNKVDTEHIPFRLGAALSGEADTDMRLHPGDVLTVKEMTGWKDIGATVTLDGAVVHPGTYGIQEGEHLSDVIERAGGFRSDAYPYGAIFEREEIRELEEKNRAQLISQAKQEGTGLGGALEDSTSKDASLLQWRDTVEKLETTPAVGRMVIHISGTKAWIHTPADVQLRKGDSIYIPKKPNFVMIQGAVYNQTAISFRPGKSASWYLHQAGGATSTGDKKNIFIVRANGTVAGGAKGLFSGGALDAPMQPGDMIVVPSKALGGGFKWRETLQVAQLVSAVGIAVQVARGF